MKVTSVLVHAAVWNIQVQVGNGQLGGGGSLIDGQDKVLREIRAVTQEMGFDLQGRGLDHTVPAIACFSGAPCSETDCTKKALAALENQACSAALYGGSPTATLHPGSSDGHSLGVAAMMIGGDIGEFTEAACNAYNNSTLGSECAGTVPFQAIIDTMSLQKDGVCADFNNYIIGQITTQGTVSSGYSTDHGGGGYSGYSLFSDYYEDEYPNPYLYWSPDTTPSTRQIEIIEQTVPNIVASSFDDATIRVVEAGLDALGLTWASIVGPLLGFQGDIKATTRLAALETLATQNGVEDENILEMAKQLVSGTKSESDVPYFLAEHYGQAAVEVLIANISAVPNMPPDVVDVVRLFFAKVPPYWPPYLFTLYQDVIGAIIGTCAADSNVTNASGKKEQIFNSIEDAIYIGFETESEVVAFLVNSTCSFNETACETDVSTAVECMTNTLEIVIPQILELETSWFAYLDVQPANLFFPTMEDGIKVVLAPLAPVLDVFTSDPMHSPTNVTFIDRIRSGVGCALAKAGVDDNTFPLLRGPKPCYISTLMSIDPDLVATFVYSSNPTTDKIFGLGDSLHSLEERCSVVGVRIQPIPQPTSTPSTRAPTTQTLNGGVAVSPSLITTASLFSAVALLLV